MMQQTYIQLTPSSAQQVANEKAEIKPIEGISNQRVAQEKGPAAIGKVEILSNNQSAHGNIFIANLAPSTGKSRIPRKPNDFKKVSLSSKPIHIQPKSKATPITNNELPSTFYRNKECVINLRFFCQQIPPPRLQSLELC